LVDIRSGRCKGCNDDHKPCDLRVTFKEFERLARLRSELVKKSEELEDELTLAEEEAARAHLRVVEARNRARTARKRALAAELKEDEAYARESAGIAEVAEMEVAANNSVSGPSSSTVDVESWGFNPADLSALPEEWSFAGGVSAEWDLLAGGLGGGTPPVEAGNSSSS
jgi:hypothetical protein